MQTRSLWTQLHRMAQMSSLPPSLPPSRPPLPLALLCFALGLRDAQDWGPSLSTVQLSCFVTHEASWVEMEQVASSQTTAQKVEILLLAHVWLHSPLPVSVPVHAPVSVCVSLSLFLCLVLTPSKNGVQVKTALSLFFGRCCRGSKLCCCPATATKPLECLQLENLKSQYRLSALFSRSQSWWRS